MNSTSPTITTTALSPSVNGGNDSGLSPLDIGIIVFCVVCGLTLALLCTFIIMNRQRLFRFPAKKKMAAEPANESIDDDLERGKDLDEKPAWRFWPSLSKSAPLIESTDNNRRHIDTINGPKTRTSEKDTQLNSTLLSSLPLKIYIKKKKAPTTAMTGRTTLDDIPLPPTNLALLTPPSIAITKASLYQKGQHELFEEGYDPKALRSPYYQHRPRHHNHQQQQQQQHNQFTSSLCTLTNASSGDSVSSSVNDPSLLESLERQKQINVMYYKSSSTSAGTQSTSRHHRQSPSWGSSTIIQQPCIGKSNNNSSLLSLSMIEKQEQEAELQRFSISSYHVW